ncbi:MAG: hypothetical protein QOE11_2361 [Solirubrobacteraceae bacterium]|jgi:hypothetical protein|nr:hypothetical protein [Solirubrobacteraceae bacterium]
MLVLVNALLYVFALGLAMAVIGPLPENATRRARVARAALACGGSLTVAAAIVLALLGLWFESALAGTGAIVVVGACLCVGMTRVPEQGDDSEDEDDDGGGSHFRPAPPEPTKPDCGPSEDLWADFDAARSDWERERQPTPA